MYKYLFYGWLILILAVSSIPSKSMGPEKIANWDKAAHLLEYAILGTLFLLMRHHQNRKVVLRDYLLLAVFLPLFDELHQLAIPNRSCSHLDLLANFAGINLPFLFVTIRKQIRLWFSSGQ